MAVEEEDLRTWPRMGFDGVIESWHEVQVYLTANSRCGEWVPLGGRMTLADAREFRRDQLRPQCRARVVEVQRIFRVVE